MGMMDAALGSLNFASADAMTQCSMAMVKESMDAEAQSVVQMLEMPTQQLFQVRGSQPGDTPAILKGSFFDTYA